MTSAFSPPKTFLPRLAPVAAQQPQQRSVWESETEDEEVKRNCMFGVTPDSDDLMTTTSYNDSDDDDDDDSDDEERVQQQQEDRRCGVVHFMARLRPSPRIVKPAASRRPTLSPPLELDDEDEEDVVVAAEVGARGVALALDSEDDDVSEDDDSDMESVSGSDADAEESDMEDEEEYDDDDDDEEEQDDEEQEDEEEEPSWDASLPQDVAVTLERPPLEDVPAEDETASVILQALEEDEDDEEISSLIDSVQEQDEEPLTDKTHLIVGVAQDRQDHANHHTVPRVKRVLSLDETLLSQQQQDAMGMLLQQHPIDNEEEQVVLKKRRKSEHDVTSTLESFTLGPAMTLLLAETATPSEYATPSRFLSPMISSSEELEDDDEEEDELVNVLDGQLRYELESTASSGTGDQSPVPLLTPPDSPVLGMTVCEWPSNLVVDSALTAAITTHIRPIDTAEWSEDDEATAKTTSFLLPSASSLLTPLMRGIQVGDAPPQGR